MPKQNTGSDAWKNTIKQLTKLRKTNPQSDKSFNLIKSLIARHPEKINNVMTMVGNKVGFFGRDDIPPLDVCLHLYEHTEQIKADPQTRRSPLPELKKHR